MTRGGKLSNETLVIFGSLVVLMFAYFAFGAHIVTNAIGYTTVFHIDSVNVTGGTQFVLNLSVNNTDTGNGTAGITQVIVTLPAGVSFIDMSNGTADGETFNYSNFTSSITAGFGDVLTWANASILVNGSGTTGVLSARQFFFNVSANLSTVSNNLIIKVDTINASLGRKQTNLTLIVNDSAYPRLINFSLPTNTSGNLPNAYIIFNITAADNGPIDTIIVTLLNSTNGTAQMINGTNYSILRTNVTKFLANFSGLKNGNYILNATVNDTRNLMNFTHPNGANTANQILVNISDALKPNVTIGTGTPVDYSNESSIYVNVSVIETNEANITFYLSAPNGTVWNASTFTDARTRTINWSSSVFTDGNYTFNVSVEDYGPNYNTTISRNIRLDRTQPVVSMTCTPIKVTVGNTVTCSCSRSDAMTGVDSYSFTTYPSTVDTGTYTTTCTATDYVGNSRSHSATYTVELGSSGSSGSSGSGGSSSASEWTTTHLVTDAQLTEGFAKQVAEKERFSVPVETSSGGGGASETHYVGVKDISATTVTIEVSSTPQTAILNVGETKTFEVTDDNYYDLSVTLNSITGTTKADVSVKSVHQLISGAEEPVAEAEEEVTTPQESPETVEEGSSAVGWIIGIIVMVLIIAAVIFFVVKRR